MINDLICYACIGDKDTKTFKNEYFKFLSVLWDYMYCWENWSGNSGWGPYEDPDSMASGKRINPQFYMDLREFLNAQAEDEKCKKYKFENNFIKWGDDVALVSDQFGFSAPSLKLNHPYDIYLRQCKNEGKNKDDAINKVINWVMESRTIGGSFLWPKGIWDGYNPQRGGSVYKKGGSYIEDRVDLTLCEIKHYLDTIKSETLYDLYESDTLYKYIKKDPVGRKWIESFGKSEESEECPGFKGYVDYFCFNPFVDEKKGYMPYDIVKSDMVSGDKDKQQHIKESDIIIYKDRTKNSIYDLSTDDLERMFNNINYMIKKRSKMMIERINLSSAHVD